MLTRRTPLRVAVLCSRRAPGLAHLLTLASRPERSFEIVSVITSEPACPDADLVRGHGVPMQTHDIRACYAARASNVYRDFETRREYDRETVAKLELAKPDVVLLDGYLYLLTRPMLEAYRHRMLNLHFSDLSLRRRDHGPLYAGIRAVRDALADGRAETRATVHVVNEEPDGGAPLVRSWAYPVSPMVAQARDWHATDMLKAYAFAHQEWMIRDASGPLLAAALSLVATGAVALDAFDGVSPDGVVPWLLDERGRMTPPPGANARGRQDHVLALLGATGPAPVGSGSQRSCGSSGPIGT